MIAIVTSCMCPATVKSFFGARDRIEQTKNGLEKLETLPLERIFLFDNSDLLAEAEVLDVLKDFQKVEKHHQRQFQFSNKGMTEALLLLNHMQHIPDNVPILKISGRYSPNEDFKLLDTQLFETYDFIGIGENFDKKVSSFNTRAYYAKNKAVLSSTLVLALEEMLSYSKGIHGLRSLFAALAACYAPIPGSAYQLSLEQAFARILKYKKNYLLVSKSNIEGYVAGSGQLDFISE